MRTKGIPLLSLTVAIVAIFGASALEGLKNGAVFVFGYGVLFFAPAGLSALMTWLSKPSGEKGNSLPTKAFIVFAHTFLSGVMNAIICSEVASKFWVYSFMDPPIKPEQTSAWLVVGLGMGLIASLLTLRAKS